MITSRNISQAIGRLGLHIRCSRERNLSMLADLQIEHQGCGDSPVMGLLSEGEGVTISGRTWTAITRMILMSRETSRPNQNNEQGEKSRRSP